MPQPAYELYERIRTDPQQERAEMRCNALLTEAARQWIVLSIQLNQFAHVLRYQDPDTGEWHDIYPHQFLRSPNIRYHIPVWWPDNANYCQALGGNTVVEKDGVVQLDATVDTQYRGWAESPYHADLIFGRNPTSLPQTEIGLWFFYEDGIADVDAMWCWFSSTPEPPRTSREVQARYFLE